MPKYEIMTILDPKAEMAIIDNLLKTVFGDNSTEKLHKLETTNLAYPIRKSKIAQYFLVELNAPTNLIEEFVRRANITREIWRYLIVNLDSEKGLNKKPKIRERNRKYTPRRDRFDKPNFRGNPKSRFDQQDQQGTKNQQNFQQNQQNQTSQYRENSRQNQDDFHQVSNNQQNFGQNQQNQSGYHRENNRQNQENIHQNSKNHQNQTSQTQRNRRQYQPIKNPKFNQKEKENYNNKKPQSSN